MQVVLERILDASILILAFAYPGLWLFLKFWRNRQQAPNAEVSASKSVTILVAAFNESKIIQDKIDNFLQLDYPEDKLNLVIVSDCSTDGTDELVRNASSSRIRLINYGERMGKTLILNRTIPELDSDLIVLTDANVMFEAQAIRAFARWFSDESIGLVCGYEERRVPLKGTAIGTESAYREFEVGIKELQSQFGAVLGAHGGMYCLRRKCWKQLPDNALSNDDLLTGLNTLKQGFKVVMDRSARALEITGNKLQNEFQRRIRIGTGNYQAFGWHLWLMNPLHGWASFFYWIHKAPRWYTPHLMLTALLSNLLLVGSSTYANSVLAVQVFFYGMCLLGFMLDSVEIRAGKLMAPYHFVSMNLAVFIGFLHWLRGVRSSTWTPTERD